MVSYARVTLRDKNVSRKILKITVIINKLLNEKIRYNYRRKKTSGCRYEPASMVREFLSTGIRITWVGWWVEF